MRRPAFYKIILIMSLISSLVSFSSCSKKENSEPTYKVTPGPNGEPIYKFNNSFEASLSAEKYSLTCKNAPCPETVGSVISHVSDDEITQCTFSLIGDDIAVTNRHCVPTDVARVGASCDGAMEFILLSPGSTHSTQIFQCDKVLSIPLEYKDDPNNRIQRDFAVLKIFRKKPNSTNPNSRTQIFQPSQSGIKDGEILHVISLDPFSARLGSEFREQDCQAIMSPYLIKDYTDIHDPLISFKNCHIIQGNSGSPVIDSNNNLKAVIFATLMADGKKAKISNNQMDRRTQKARSILAKSQIGYATNFSCIDIPEFGLRLWSDKDCVSNKKKLAEPEVTLFNDPAFQKARDAELELKLKQINAKSEILEWNFDQPNHADWSVEMTQHLAVQELVPLCFNGLYDKFSWKPTLEANDFVTLLMSLPIEIVDPDIDQNLKDFLVTSEQNQSVRVRFNYASLMHSPQHTTEVQVERTGFQLSKNKIESYQIGFCRQYVK